MLKIYNKNKKLTRMPTLNKNNRLLAKQFKLNKINNVFNLTIWTQTNKYKDQI